MTWITPEAHHRAHHEATMKKTTGIEKRENKNGTISYRAQVRKGTDRFTATFIRLSDAMRWREDVIYALDNNLPMPGEELPQDDLSILSAVEQYLAETGSKKKRSVNTKRIDQGTGNRIINAFNEKSLRTLTREDIEQHIESRLEKVGPASIRHDLSMLNRIYETARIQWRLSGLENPAQSVKMPAEAAPREQVVPEIRFPALFEECKKSKNKTLYPLVLLLSSTGMRPSEAILLRWWQIDFVSGVITLTKTKTGKPRRIPLIGECYKVLKGMQGENGDLVFISEETAKYDRPARFFRRAFEQACIRAGINKPRKRDLSKDAEYHDSDMKNVTLYTLRHSTATYLLMAGESLETVRDILGHKNISQTSKYIHISEEYKRNALDNENLPWKKS